MSSRNGKRYERLAKRVYGQRRYSVEEAVDLLGDLKSARFVETVELAIKLDIDPKQADQLVRGSYALPHGLGKVVRVIAFAEGEMAEEAKAVGAEDAGGEDLVKRVQDGWMDFDVAIAHPSMMRHVGRLGRILGPQGKMPSPKSGTVTPDVVQAVKDFRGGKIEYRNDGIGNLNVPVGKIDFDREKLIENIQGFLSHLNSVRPSAVKGTFLAKAALSLTMSPGVRLAV
jgi:large subunit ribosomal protein L1